MQDVKLSQSTFLKAIIPAVTGIAAARFTDVPAMAAVLCFAAVFLCTVLFFRKSISQIYIWFAILFFFFAASSVCAPESKIPQGVKVDMVAQVSENPYLRGRWQNTTAHVGYYRPSDSPGAAWVRVDERIQLMADTVYAIGVGEQLAFGGWVNPIDTVGTSYGNLMKFRGYHSRVYLTPGNMIRKAPHVSRTPVYYAALMQDAAMGRLSRLGLEDDEIAVVSAMTAGDKRGIDKDVRDSYSSTGAAHLLAVSGLHVGIVFMLVNVLLYLLPAMRRGHIYKNIAAVVVIWLYAMMAGLSPSVVRAALMFSFAQAALASGSYRSSLNIVLGSAVVMLAINPNYAGDMSFMLSYVAVLSIAAFFPPLFRLVRSGYKVLDALSSIVLVGVIATLGTAPLVAYWFGNFPVAGMLINPVVILTANVVVMAGVLWVVFPVAFLNPVFSWVLDLAAGVQNAVVGWSASQSWASIAVKFPLWGVLALYAVYIAVAAWLYNRPQAQEQKFARW